MSTSIAAQFVKERPVIFDFSELEYETSPDNYARLADAQGRTLRNVDKVIFDYGISFEQSTKGRQAICRLAFAIPDLAGPAPIQNIKDQDCLDIWITVTNTKSCILEGDSTVAAGLPLAVLAPSLKKFKLTLDIRRLKKKLSRAKVRDPIIHHLTARLSQASESTIRTYFDNTRRLVEKESEAQKKRTPSLESCKVQTLKIFGKMLGIGIWPRADLAEDQRSQEIGSNFAMRYKIHNSSVFTLEALHSHKIPGSEEPAWEFTVLTKIPRCTAPIVGVVNNPFHAEMDSFIQDTDMGVTIEPIHNDVFGEAQLSAIDTFKADLDEVFKHFFTGNTAMCRITLPINALFLPNVAYDAVSNVLLGQKRPKITIPNIVMNDSQDAAVSDAFKHKMFFIYGPAATGKSTVMAMIATLKMANERKVLLTATRHVGVDALFGRCVEIGLTQRKELPFVRVYSWAHTNVQYLEGDPVFKNPYTLDNQRVALARRRNLQGFLQGRRTLLETGFIEDKKTRENFRKDMSALTRAAMDNAQAVFCTTSMLRCRALVWEEKVKKDGKDDTVIRNWPAKTIIFDEMACSNPAEYLIAVTAFNKDVEDITAGGDHLQLNSRVGTEEAKQAWQKPSLFEVGVKKYASQTLNVSYRQHDQLADGSYPLIYEGKVTAFHKTSQPRPFLKGYLSRMPCSFDSGSNSYTLSNFVHFLDVPHGQCERSPSGSQRNVAEVDLVEDLVKTLLKMGIPLNDTPKVKVVGVLAGYADQVMELTRRFKGNANKLKDDRWNRVHAVTADGIQGGEFEILIVSLVRTHESRGFIGEKKRANVITTRPREVLIYVGLWAFWQSHNTSANYWLDKMLYCYRNSFRDFIVKPKLGKGSAPASVSAPAPAPTPAAPAPATATAPAASSYALPAPSHGSSTFVDRLAAQKERAQQARLLAEAAKKKAGLEAQRKEEREKAEEYERDEREREKEQKARKEVMLQAHDTEAEKMQEDIRVRGAQERAELERRIAELKLGIEKALLETETELSENAAEMRKRREEIEKS